MGGTHASIMPSGFRSHDDLKINLWRGKKDTDKMAPHLLRLSLGRSSHNLCRPVAAWLKASWTTRCAFTSSDRISGEANDYASTSHPRHNHLPKFPKRIILMRHGESLGNVDETLYAEVPDWKIPLTRRGERQCEAAAHALYDLIKGESVFCYCSPYKRTRETWEILRSHLQEQVDVDIIGVREEPRIAEQQFGNFQNPRKVRTAKAERRTFGRFFFRFPNGEAGLDVYNRVSSFLATLSRDLLQFQDSGADMDKLNIIIVTHGLTLRLLLMRYFQLSVEEFEHSFNPQNAKIIVMERIEPKPMQINDMDTMELLSSSEKAGAAAAAAAAFSSTSSLIDTPSGRPFFRLAEEAKEALNLKGDVSSEKPAFFRGDALEQIPYDLKQGIRK